MTTNKDMPKKILDDLNIIIATCEKHLRKNKEKQSNHIQSVSSLYLSETREAHEFLVGFTFKMENLQHEESTLLEQLSVFHSMKVKLKLSDQLSEIQKNDVSSMLDCIENFRVALAAVSFTPDDLSDFFHTMQDTVSTESP